MKTWEDVIWITFALAIVLGMYWLSQGNPLVTSVTGFVVYVLGE